MAKTILSPKEDLFCSAYASPESETYGNGTKSATVAGYPEATAGNMACKLKKKPQIIERLEQLYKENAADVGKVMSDLEHQRILAIAKGDIASANRASELQGKRYGMFTDRQIIEQPEQRELDERESAEAEEIAKLRLKAFRNNNHDVAEAM